MISLSTKALMQRALAYHVAYAKATGSVKLAILWGQIHYWKDKAADPDGWVYKTRESIFDETGLSRKEQETARELGEKMGVLKSEVRGTPPTVHFLVDEDRMIELIEMYERGNQKEEPKKGTKERRTSSIEWLASMSEADLDEMASQIYLRKYRVKREFILARAEDVIDYCQSKPKKYADYKAALRNFIKSHLERHPEEGIKVTEQKAHEVQEYEKEIDRSPEAQASLRAKLDEMRKGLADKLSMKKNCT